MAVAALTLSILAILVAAASAWYTRRQAISAEGVRRIEAARRQDEVRPILVGEYVDASETRDGQRPGVKLTNEGPLDLDRVEVAIIPANRAHEAAIDGIHDDSTGRPVTACETGALRRGESLTFDVIPARYMVDSEHELDRGDTAAFRCTCHAAGHEPWVTIVSVDFPGSPWIY